MNLRAKASDEVRLTGGNAQFARQIADFNPTQESGDLYSSSNVVRGYSTYNFSGEDLANIAKLAKQNS